VAHLNVNKMRRFCSLSNIHDFEPHSVIKVIKKGGNSAGQVKKSNAKVVTENREVSKNDASRDVNDLGIQMISRNLYQQIFKNKTEQNVSTEKIEQ
jgi:hypothetical protein